MTKVKTLILIVLLFITSFGCGTDIYVVSPTPVQEDFQFYVLNFSPPEIYVIAEEEPPQQYKDGYGIAYAMNLRTGNLRLGFLGYHYNEASDIHYFSGKWWPSNQDEIKCLRANPPAPPYCNDGYKLWWLTIFGSYGGRVDANNLPLYWYPKK